MKRKLNDDEFEKLYSNLDFPRTDDEAYDGKKINWGTLDEVGQCAPIKKENKNWSGAAKALGWAIKIKTNNV